MASSQQPRPTARVESRCIAPKTSRGTLSFEINGYHHLHRGRGNFIQSSSIDVGGYSWCLRFYPEGDHMEESKGFVGVYLRLLSKNTEVKAIYDFRLLDLTTGLPTVLGHREEPILFSSVDASANLDSRGMRSNKFLERSALEASAHLRDGRLVIECDITIVKEPLVVETMTTSKVEQVNRELSRDFAKLLESKEGADVSFQVRGEVISAHKIVLAARSPVLKAEFYGPLRQQQIGEERPITIEDMQASVFKALLYFMYTESVSPCMDGLDRDEKEELNKHLLAAADRYDVQGLRSVCETNLCESLQVSTVATMLAFADQHSCGKLKEACIEYIVSNDRLDDLVASDGYDHLKSSFPAVFVELFEKSARSSKVSLARPRHPVGACNIM